MTPLNTASGVAVLCEGLMPSPTPVPPPTPAGTPTGVPLGFALAAFFLLTTVSCLVIRKNYCSGSRSGTASSLAATGGSGASAAAVAHKPAGGVAMVAV